MKHTEAILIGSRAMNFWFPDARKPNNDFDFFIDTGALDEWNLHNRHQCRKVHKIEDDKIQFDLKIGSTLGFDNTRYKSVDMFIGANELMPNMEAFGLKFKVASPETLLAIKKSHIHHRHNWRKHIEDYTFLKSKNLKLSSKLQLALDQRIEERNARGDFKTPESLNVTNEQFFSQSDSAVRRKFMHDDLHKTIMYYDEPLFNKAKRDKSKALLDEELFNKFDYIDKCRLVREEACVIGLERIIIPEWHNKYVLCAAHILDKIELTENIENKAYNYGLMRVSTDLTKGWFREFALNNYKHLAKPDNNFLSKFLTAFEEKRLQPK
jgi:hypothetical protein